MTYTATFNPSTDYVIFANDFKIGGSDRATVTCKFAGKEGANASCVLKALDIESTAPGFTGRFPRKSIIDTLNNSAIQLNFTEADEDTRVDVKLKTGQETEINAPDPHITSTQFEQLLQQIKNVASEDTVIVTRSVPSSIPSDAYAQIAQITAQTSAKLVVSAEEELAESILPYHPLFTKPNKDELEVMLNTTMNSDTDVIEYGHSLVNKGVQSVTVPLGGDGAIYIGKEISIKAVNSQRGMVSTASSGDSIVADTVAGIASGLTIEKTFQQAVVRGIAMTFDKDLATWDVTEKMKPQVMISVLDGE